MTLREFYDTVGGSYDEAIRRLMTDQLMLKYLKLFAGSDDYGKMMDALREERWEDAFHCSHNLKGVCLNLGLGKLSETSSALCDSLRGGKPSVDITPLVAAVEEANALVTDALAALTASKP